MGPPDGLEDAAALLVHENLLGQEGSRGKPSATVASGGISWPANAFVVDLPVAEKSTHRRALSYAFAIGYALFVAAAVGATIVFLVAAIRPH
jgi:hypothetical protein